MSTPCEDHGWQVGDHFEVIDQVSDEEYVELGSIVELIEDDGSDEPGFKLIKGHMGEGYDHIRNKVYLDIEEVEKIEQSATKKETPCSKNGYVEGDLFKVTEENGIVELDSIIELYNDDGTHVPEFKLFNGKMDEALEELKNKTFFLGLTYVTKVGGDF